MKNSISYENLIQLAAKESFQRKISEMPSDDELKRLYGNKSARHKKKMQKMLNKDKRQIAISNLSRRFSKIYFIFTSSLIVVFSTLLSARAVRESISVTILDWKHNFTGIFIENENIRSGLPDMEITYIPEGFSLVSDEQISLDTRIINYENNSSDYIIIYISTYSQNFTNNVDNEYSEYYMLRIDDIPATWVQQDNQNTLVISQNSIFYNISGTVSLDEIVRIYKNIK